MEQSPLIQAQNHARNAANATDPATAGAEHEQAAGQFGSAAKGTKHPEAVRTLKLLEQHHKKIAELLRFRSAHPSLPSPRPQDPNEQPSPNTVQITTADQPKTVSPYRAPLQTAPLPQRDIASSIASNLASARGIPSSRQRRPQSSQPPNPQRRSKLLEESYRSGTPKAQVLPLTAPAPSVPAPPPTAPSSENSAPKSDEPFQKFYSAFESLFSRLSAPLAFAGLPLDPDEPPPSSSPAPSLPTTPKLPTPRDRHPVIKPPSSRRALEASQRASADPDYSALFSRAALRAVADEHGPGSVGANESFYVVPTSGHTLAYADILARQHHERHRGRISREDREGQEDDFEGDEELFVDARETPGPPSPEFNRKRRGGAKIGTKTVEEIQLENEAMKALLDQTARRLLEFEMSAQSSSVALQRSVRQLNVHSAEVGGNGSKEMEEKVREMEEQVLARMKEMMKLERENEKLKGVVGRYRDRFESIKAGARARRDESGRKTEDG